MSEAATNIKDREAICAKAADNVATIWETLLEDDATKKIRERIRETGKCSFCKVGHAKAAPPAKSH